MIVAIWKLHVVQYPPLGRSFLAMACSLESPELRDLLPRVFHRTAADALRERDRLGKPVGLR